MDAYTPVNAYSNVTYLVPMKLSFEILSKIVMANHLVSTLPVGWFQNHFPELPLSHVLQFCTCTDLVKLCLTAQSVFNKVKRHAQEVPEHYTQLPSLRKYEYARCPEHIDIMEMQLFFHSTLKIPPPQFPALKSLILTDQCFWAYEEHLQEAVQPINVMVHNLKRYDALEALSVEALSLSSASLESILRHTPILNTIEMKGKWTVDENYLNASTLDLLKHKNLTSLALYHIRNFPLIELVEYVSLQRLHLHGIFNLNDLKVSAITPFFPPQLTQLVINHCMSLTHQGLQNLACQQPLTELDLTHQKVTDACILNLVEASPGLATLRIDELFTPISDHSLEALLTLREITVLEIRSLPYSRNRILRFSEKSVQHAAQKWKNISVKQVPASLCLEEKGHIVNFSNKLQAFYQGQPVQFVS